VQTQEAEQLKALFGKNVRKFRKLRNLTQKQLADLIDTDERSISNIERGIHAPTFTRIVDLAFRLNVAEWQLFYDWQKAE